MWPEQLIQDVRYGVRTLRGSPAFTLVAVTLLALAIGANTAIFSLVSAVLLRPLPFPEPDRLTLLWDDFSAKRGPSRVEPTPADYVDWKARSRSFTDMAAFVAQTYNLTGSGDPDKLEGIRTTANLFTVLGMQAIIGRTLEPSDDDPASGTPVVVINERLWRTRFGADPSFVGRSIDLDGLAHTVVGIVPADFQFPNKEAVFWMPARFTDEERANRTAYNYDILARLEPGTSLSQARAEMATIAQQLAREYPRAYEGVSIAVTPLHEHLTRDTRSAISILLAAVGLVLCIACANVSNLLLARGAVRRKELAVRKALGAPNALVIRQLLTESAILAGVGASAGVMLSTFAFGYLARLVPGVLPQGTGPMLDARVLLFTTGVAVVMVLGFGTGPAVIAAHVDLDAALKTGATRGTTASDSGRLRNALVVMEVTLTVVLLVGAGLLLRSYARVLDVEPGFRFQHLLIAETALPPSKYRTLESRSAFYQRVLERVSALPEVVSAGYVNFPPLVFKGGRSYISIEGRPTPPPDDFIRYVISDRVVSTGYFAALGVPLVRGRSFDQRDGAEAPRSVIINQKMAITHWPGEDPLGHRIKMGAGESTSPWFTVVGVVGDMRQMGLDTPAEPEMYFSLTQAGATVPFLWPRSLVVRSRGEPLALSTSVRRAVWDVDPDEPVSNIQSMEQVVDIELQSRNMQLTLVGAFAVLALVMAAVGLYGVLSYNVAQRSGEIGVRLALGAQRVTVIAQVVRGALLLVGSGIVLGLASAFVLTRLLTSLLFSISPADPATFLTTALLLILTALVASYFPARRSANLDPISVLKSE